ncbi:MAG: hypothetical protein WA705_15365 [Candidatus Ozemobacteraceae bacterium]
MKYLFFFLVFVTRCLSLNAYVLIMSTDELVLSSELILSGTVVEKTVIGKKNGYDLAKNTIHVLKVLKGSLSAEKPFEFTTCTVNAKEKNFEEDPPADLPEKNSQVLLFLRKDSEKKWTLTDPRQGIIRVKDGKVINPRDPNMETIEKSIRTK